MNTSGRFTALSLNMDSFGHATGTFPLDKDPFWFEVLDLILDVLDFHNVKATIYVIGKDLEDPNIRIRVKDLHNAGHEIANHTYSHQQDFAFLSLSEAYGEIEKSHSIISSATGVKPTAFLAPAWNWNPHQENILSKLGYTNDSSIFNSPLMILMNLKMAYNFFLKSLRTKEIPQTYSLASIFRRKDLPFNLFGTQYGELKSFFGRKTAEFGSCVTNLPITQNPFTIPYWFTLEFINEYLADRAFDRLINQEFRYLLFHPADFADNQTLGNYQNLRNHSLERFDVDKKYFRKRFEERLNALGKNSVFVTMSELAVLVRK